MKESLNKNVFAARLAMKMLLHRQSLLSTTTLFSIGGLVFGVASLVVSMSIMSGFEATLSRALSDVSGHVRVYNRSTQLQNPIEVFQQLREQEPRIIGGAPFLVVEGILSHQGTIGGILFHGLGPSFGAEVLNIKNRLIKFDRWSEVGDLEAGEVYVGKGVAEHWDLKINDKFKIVVPVAHQENSGFSRRVSELQVKGIIDLGRYDWNQRFLMGNIKTAQMIGQISPSQFFGLTLRLRDVNEARNIADLLSEKFKTYFDFQSWKDLNENLLRAVAFDRAVVFFVVLLIVVVAAFNISSSLIVSVMSRFSDIAVLRAIGLDESSVQRLFVWQGFFVAAIGTILGLFVGFGLGYLFEYLQQSMNLLNGSVYRLEGLQVSWRIVDLAAVVFATLAICIIASWFPARKGAQMNVVEGLRYG